MGRTAARRRVTGLLRLLERASSPSPSGQPSPSLGGSPGQESVSLLPKGSRLPFLTQLPSEVGKGEPEGPQRGTGYVLCP